MKLAILIIGLSALGFWALACGGCATSTPGANYALGTYTAMVDSTPDKVTDAAKKSAEDLNLQNVLSSSTKIDGSVTARDASGEDVTINVEQAGDNVSKVSIHVGAGGDENVSKQLYDHIKSHLHWF